VPVLITAGSRATYHDDDRTWRVPKVDLVNVLQLLLGASLIRCHTGRALAETLTRELTEYQTKVGKAGNEQFGAWREGQHDDLVLAVALACWMLERRGGDDPHPYGDLGPVPGSAPPPGVFRGAGGTMPSIFNGRWPDGVFRGAPNPWGR
jgi:hypothetical protein